MASMDKTDLKILSILQNNARISNVDIAKKIGKAPSVSLERIRKLERAKIIEGYHTRINTESVDFGLLAFLWIKITVSDWTDELGERLGQVTGVQEVHEIAGTDTYLVKIRTRSAKDLSRIIKDELASIKEVVNTNTTIVLNTVKEDQSLPLGKDRAFRGRI